MLAFKRIWENMDKTVILNCWMHNYVLGSPEQPDVAPAVNLQEACDQISEYVSELFPARNRMDINEILNPLNKNDYVQNVSVVDGFGTAT